jgi:hypothetical protein
MIGCQRLQFDYRGFSHPLKSVQAISATAFLTQKVTDAWGLLLVVAPGYADDFQGKASLDSAWRLYSLPAIRVRRWSRPCAGRRIRAE